MFVVLLIVNFIVAFVVCLIVASIFRTPINKILQRLVAEDIYAMWSKYILFAIYVVGISGGVRLWDLEKYITPNAKDGTVIVLTRERWILEIYRSIIGALESDAWMLLIFFVFALVAFVIVKGIDSRRQQKA